MKITNVNDYVDSVQEKFPGVKKSDIKRILRYLFKQIYLINVYGGDVCLKNKNLWTYFGHLTKNSLKHFDNYRVKQMIKIKILNKRLQIPWDGYYYFALTENQQQFVNSQKKSKGRPKKHINYGNILMYKLLEVCELGTPNGQYFYRVPSITFLGNCLYKENYSTDKAEFIKQQDPRKLIDILTTNKEYNYGG